MPKNIQPKAWASYEIEKLVQEGTKDNSIKIDLSSVVDKNDNPRFIEGDITPLAIEGFTINYAKWSLSGTHLMIVIAGRGIASTSSDWVYNYAQLNLPDFIKDKILPVFSNYVITSDLYYYADDNTKQTSSVHLRKIANDIIISLGAITLDKDRGFRIAFDLLIDTD